MHEAMIDKHQCNGNEHALLRRIKVSEVQITYQVMRQPDLVIDGNFVNLVLKHLPIGVLPKQDAQREHWNVRHNIKDIMGQEHSVHWRHPEKVSERVPIDDILIEESNRANKVQHREGATEK